MLYCDVDEIIAPDPDVALGLNEYSMQDLPLVFNAIGFNIVHCVGEEPDFDSSKPVTLQRRYVCATSTMCKPLLIGRDVKWSPGSHSADARVSFDALYLFHLRNFDLNYSLRRLRRTREMQWAHHSAGEWARVGDDFQDWLMKEILAMPRIDAIDFRKDIPPVGPFLERILLSQAGREFADVKFDDNITLKELWKIPERFVGLF